ncbi:HNH endonuclease [Nitrincola iocasae]|uniref:HNH nuclease domain-containing protein n=1 Tax=Nitrincola iocasae TaxID=2614693 RepID=A0A5J6LFH9_9GAMM|nr:HNH endonuclease [Nitrincola iocasae]QEW07317.1 hypothetical protein F5I99_12855 [Nitrincola iocasae]
MTNAISNKHTEKRTTENGLSFEELQEAFALCLKSEALIRLKGRSNEAGSQIPFMHLGAGNYKQVSINGRRHKFHRIIWALANGRWPVGMEVDHINRDPRNNHPDNLREVSYSQNQRNCSPNRDTGFYGVYRTRSGGYQAGVSTDGKRFMSKTIPDKEVAAFVADVLTVVVYGPDPITIQRLNTDRFPLFFASAVSANDLHGAVDAAISACQCE